MLVAAAAMAFTSCQKEETAAPETVSATLTMHADVEQTKTYLENNTVLWGKDEAVTLYVGAGEKAKFFNSTSTDDYNGEASASFTFAIEDVAQADSYALGGIYPASAAMEDNENPVKFRTILPQTQNAEVGKYDPSAYIMVLKPETVDALPEQYQASFRRATALNKITLTNVKEDITTVEITVPESMALAGRRYFDLTTGTSGEIYYGKSNTITVNSQFTGNSIDVWFCSWGVELTEGQELTVRMKNANKSYTRTIQAKAAGIKFIEGNLNTLKINMADAAEESFSNFSGEWLITGTTGEKTYAAGTYVSGNNIKASVAITVENDVIESVDGIENCKMLLTQITEGDYEGMYTIQDANGNYLYAASSSGNHLKAGASADDANYYWTVEYSDGKYSVVASKSSNRNVMQFNGSEASNMLFACYASASQGAITLYPYSMVKVDTTPKISVTNASYSVKATDTSVEIPYSVKNITGAITATVAEGATMSIVSANATESKVTVSFAANEESAEKTATIVLSYEGAESVSVVITQEGKTSEIVKEETVIYQTAFNYPINGSAYNSATEYVGTDDAGTSWGIKYGNWNSSNCAQLRVYSAGNFGSVYMKFDVANATRVTYKAKVSNTALKLNTYYSTDSGSTWTEVNSSKALTTSLASYEFTISDTGEYSKVRIKFEATGSKPSSSNYQLTIDDVTIYGFLNGGETPEPDPTPDPEEPSTGVSKTAKITFGSNAVKISAASVTGTDSENNNWTITTVGTTSYTANSAYYQVGSSSKPATSITFTTTLPAGASVSNVEAKFGGFSNTAGNVTLTVGDTSVGTGKLNATSDVIVESTSTASGNKVTVTVTNIAKGVKCYYISVNYTE